MPRTLVFSIACIALALAGCGHRNDSSNGTTADTGADISLPKPESAGGPVTGMPAKPGPRPIGPPAATSTNQPEAVATLDSDVSAATQEPANANAPNAAIAEPTADDAVAVVQDYYSSLDSQNYAHAYALWVDGGRASGQTAQQFADGFANTAHVGMETGAPGTVEGAAGSRYIQVPVSIDATLRDGSSVEYTGMYTLRRSVVDGATPEQRAWRISSASIHEVKQ